LSRHAHGIEPGPIEVSLLTVILAVITLLLLVGCGGLQNTRTPISSDEDAVAAYETVTRRLLEESGGVQGTLFIGQSTPVLGGAPTTAAPGTFSAVVEGGLTDALANTADKVVWLAMGQAGNADLPGSDGGVIVTLSEIAFDPKRSDDVVVHARAVRGPKDQVDHSYSLTKSAGGWTITAIDGAAPGASFDPPPFAIGNWHYADASADASEDQTREWLEFRSTAAVSLLGYYVRNYRGDRYNFPDIVVPVGQPFRLHSGSGTDGPNDLYWGASREMWIHDLGVVNGKEGGVYVFDARDRLVDSLRWAATP
jgi:hypothetical protein